jgi:CheY-like chemotaxis protein
MLTQEANSGENALKCFNQGEIFDLVIVDWQMPEMDGLMLAEAIRNLPTGQNLPLVILSSLGNPPQIISNKIKFASILTKPVKQSRLYEILIEIFSPQSATIKVNSLKSEIVPIAEDNPLRILLAEDNIVNQKVALLTLKKLGYRADLAANGLEVIEAVERQLYDVILMDVQMPEMDGLEATRWICQNCQKTSRPRIIAMTANAMQGDRQMCLDAGMDDYITKPLRLETLQEALLRSFQ